MPDSFALAVVSLEIAFIGAGLIALWHFGLSPRARRTPAPRALPAWNISTTGFMWFALLVMCGAFFGANLGAIATAQTALSANARTIVQGAGAQLGMLLGIGVHRLAIEKAPLNAAGPSRRTLTTGMLTFLIALPLLTATGLIWQGFLEMTHLPAERQDLIGMFAAAKSPALLTVMIVLAIVVAPMTEELIFRAGLFRYLRTRFARPVALLAPAVLFASLHANVASFAPLVVLALVFSLAYERTGDIGTTMVAHALFNLNTIVLILSGVGDIT